MTATRTPARRFVAVLLLSLVALVTPVAGPATAEEMPAAAGNEWAPSVSAQQSALPGRLVPAGHLSGGGTHPGPVLDTLLLAPPEATVTVPAGTAVDRCATAGLDPGHGSAAELRGPPTA